MSTAGTGAGMPTRVYANLRTADLERFREMTPARVLYTRTRYDFDGSLVDPARPPVRLSRPGVIRALLAADRPVVETNEPAMGDRFAFLLAQVAAIRLRGAVTGRRATIAAYCIQNADPAAELARRWHLPAAVARPLTRAALRTLVRASDRLAFGTGASLALYRGYVGERLLAGRARLIEELPAPCACLAGAPEPRVPAQLAFVAQFSERKGIRQAMAAWDALGDRVPGATFRVVGQGPLEAEVRRWAAGRPDVAVAVDPPRAEVHRVLRTSGVAVLLSQPHGTFREQVGFPVTEGLSHGCEVVASSETGLAGWLRAHGHGVVAPDAAPEAVAAALAAAFARAAGRRGSLADLPAEDRRVTADRWMMTGAAP